LGRMSDYLTNMGYRNLSPLSGGSENGVFSAVFVYIESTPYGMLTDYTCTVTIACLADSARIVYLDASGYAANRGAFPLPTAPLAYPDGEALWLLFDGGGEAHYCRQMDDAYYDMADGRRILAPVLP